MVLSVEERAWAVRRHRVLIEHESGHAAAAVLLRRTVREIRVAGVPAPQAGYVRLVDEVDELTPQILRNPALYCLAGGLWACDQGWPPKFALLKVGCVLEDELAGDARTLARIIKHLDLDEHGWDELVADARALVARDDFGRLARGIAVALERLGVVTGEQLDALGFGPSTGSTTEQEYASAA